MLGNSKLKAAVFFWLTLIVSASLICLWAFWHLLKRLDTEILGLHNDALYSFNTLSWQWQMLSEFRFKALLDAPIMAPLPHGLAFGDNLTALALLGFPLAAFGNHILAYNVVILLTFILCAVCAAGFGRALTDSNWAGWICGLGFAFFPLRLETLYHPNNLAVMGIALMAWALVEFQKTRTHFWILVAFLGFYIQVLSSIQIAILFGLLFAVWAIVLCLSGHLPLGSSEFVKFAIGLGSLVAALLPWALIYRDVQPFLPAARSTDEMRLYTPPLTDWIDRLAPLPAITILGGLGVVLALLSLAPKIRLHLKHQVLGVIHLPGLLGATVFGFILAQGPFFQTENNLYRLPYLFLMKFIPFLDTIRAPQRIVHGMELLVCGLAAIAAAYIINGSQRLVSQFCMHRSYAPTLRKLVKITIAAGITLGLVLFIPKAKEQTRSLNLPEYAQALLQLPKDSLVAPVPLHLNWPTRPPLDFVAIKTNTKMLGGYGGAIPSVFTALWRNLGIFPHQAALDALRAAQATHVLVQKSALTSVQLAHMAAPEIQSQLELLFEGQAWQLWRLKTETPELFSLFDHAASQFSLSGPTWVAPNQVVTFALEPKAIETTRLDPVLSRQIKVEIWSDSKEQVSVQTAQVYSPFLVALNAFPYQVSLKAPSKCGQYLVRLVWPENNSHPEDRQSLNFPLMVKQSPTSRDKAPQNFEGLLENVSSPAFRNQTILAHLKIKNNDNSVWLARSPEIAPANAGQITLHLTFTGPKSMHQVHYPWHQRVLLPHDLAPGQSVSTSQLIETPALPGDYALHISLGAHQLPGGTPPITIAQTMLIE